MSKKKKNDKIIICSRCKGDGYWHSPKTGYRAKTAAGLLVDKTKKCPACNGKGEVVKPKPSKPKPKPKPKILQIHYQYDDHTEFISQKTIHSDSEFREWEHMVLDKYPLLEGGRLLCCNEKSRHFVKGPGPAKTKLPSAAQVAWDMSKGKSGSVTAN